MNRLLLLMVTFSCGSGTADEKTTEDTFSRLKARASEAKAFCKQNNFSTSFCLLADMSMHSGRNRIFVWDFRKDTVVLSGLCAHGCGDYPWASDHTRTMPAFSNVPGSHCTSLGKFRIGKRGWSSFGIHVNYLLHGLDATNSNALARQIVLHSWEIVPEQEVYPAGAPEGWGCPAISDGLMRKVDEMLKASEKPVLLWMYK